MTVGKDRSCVEIRPPQAVAVDPLYSSVLLLGRENVEREWRGVALSGLEDLPVVVVNPVCTEWQERDAQGQRRVADEEQRRWVQEAKGTVDTIAVCLEAGDEGETMWWAEMGMDAHAFAAKLVVYCPVELGCRAVIERMVTMKEFTVVDSLEELIAEVRRRLKGIEAAIHPECVVC
jgi:hypothetical protein